MMFEPTEHDVNEAVRQSINMFERARVGEVPAVEPRQPHKVLLVLDGSSQDDMSIRVGRALQSRFSCDVDVLDGRSSVTDSRDVDEVAQLLSGTVLNFDDAESYDRILAAIAATGPDLTIVPCPFGRDLDSIGTDSTGTVIDILLARASCSLLAIRQPDLKPTEYFRRVLLVLNGQNKATQSAASWATGMAVDNGEITMKLDLSQQVCDDIQQLVQTVHPDVALSSEQVKEAMQKQHLSLHQALHAASEARGIRYQLEVNCAEETGTFEWASDEVGSLTVVALDRSDPLSQGRVHDRIRCTPHCILVVMNPSDSRAKEV